MKDLKVGKGFTLVELAVAIAIIIILVSIAIPVFGEAIYKGKLSELLASFDSLAKDLEHYRQDWNVYPNPVDPPEEFGYSVDQFSVSSTLARELLGQNASLNNPNNKTALGETGGIEYILRPQSLMNMKNPFSSKFKLYYGSKNGSNYVIYTELPNGKYLVRYGDSGTSKIVDTKPTSP